MNHTKAVQSELTSLKSIIEQETRAKYAAWQRIAELTAEITSLQQQLSEAQVAEQ